jgi:prephenate dehydrogenase
MLSRVAIIGLGLLGSSMGLALRRANGAQEIVGYDKGQDVSESACSIGAIDQFYGSLADAVRGAEIIILATPVGAMHSLLRDLASLVVAGTVITDVASTKSQVVQWAETYLPATISFVGGHPMTGKEASGVGGADAELFHQCIYCLTPTPKTSVEALNKVVALVEVLKAQVWYMEPEDHDKQVASISHLPFIASSVLMNTIANDEAWSNASFLAAGGFRDMTRLAAGSPTMYRDICITNKEAITPLLDAYIYELQQLRDEIAQFGEHLYKTFDEAHKHRLQWQFLRDFPKQPKQP